jgi:hypothetical protein
LLLRSLRGFLALEAAETRLDSSLHAIHGVLGKDTAAGRRWHVFWFAEGVLLLISYIDGSNFELSESRRAGRRRGKGSEGALGWEGNRLSERGGYRRKGKIIRKSFEIHPLSSNSTVDLLGVLDVNCDLYGAWASSGHGLSARTRRLAEHSFDDGSKYHGARLRTDLR